ncbi:MAG: DUF4381 domain-containing protein [Gammaproteobacteria bacterium]
MTNPLKLPLKDIHLPGPVSWWPPAPGWWILLGLLLFLIFLSLWWYRRRQRLKLSAANLAREQLLALQGHYSTHRDPRRLVEEISILLRRLSISAFSRMQTASLTGDAWLQYLDRPMQDHPFSSGPGRILIDAPYRREVRAEEIEPVINLCKEWIDAVAGNRQRAVQ